MPAYTGQYNIEFKGLKTGMHHFSFDLDDVFFGYHINPWCIGGNVRVNVEFEKKDHLLTLECSYSGNVRVECDRCLEEFEMEMNFSSSLFVKFGEDENETDPDVVWIEEKSHKLDLDSYFIDSICLNLPVKKVHGKGPDGKSLCNIQMIEKLKNYKIKQSVKTTDPRWDKLRDIANKK